MPVIVQHCDGDYGVKGEVPSEVVLGGGYNVLLSPPWK